MTLEVAGAIQDERVLEFDYEPENGAAMRRTVSPFELSKDGATLLGWDHDRDAPRRFRLDRIVGDFSYPSAEYVRPA